MNLTEQFKNFTLLGAEWVLWLLVLLSIVSIGIMIERWRFYRARADHLQSLERDVKRALRDGDDKAFADHHGRSESLAAAVARRGLAERDHGIDAVAEAMSSEKAHRKHEYEQFLIVLATLGNNAPFIGLFGTVLGVIQAFADLAGNAQGGADVVMDGVSEALVATAIGILVAIPAVVAFNYFNRRVRAAVTCADAVAHVLLGELHARAHRGGATKDAA